MQHKNTHFLTHSLISHLSPLLLRPLLLLLRRKFSCLLSPSQKHQKKKKKKTSKNSKKKITKNPQKFAKILKESVRHFTDIPKVLIPKTKTPFPCDSPPCSSSFRRRRRRRRLHVPFLPCSNVACFRALFSWRKHCAYCAK